MVEKKKQQTQIASQIKTTEENITHLETEIKLLDDKLAIHKT